MKHLKKHPKQQRMEDMTFPLQKDKSSPVFVRMGDKIIPYKGKLGTKKGKNIVNNHSPNVDIFIDSYLDSHVYIDGKEVDTSELGSELTLDKLEAQFKKAFESGELQDNAIYMMPEQEKVIWEGREWLRSINDDRHGWHVLGWVILGVAVIISLKIVL